MFRIAASHVIGMGKMCDLMSMPAEKPERVEAALLQGGFHPPRKRTEGSCNSPAEYQEWEECPLDANDIAYRG